MKKFVAIVIALVMVLSMTSAFALNNCYTGDFAWGCPTTTTACGKATVEVVPYVKVNSACNGWEYQVSDCAAAIKTEDVFFALKVTIPADVDPAWFGVASITFESAGLDLAAEATLPTIPVFADAKGDGWVCYWNGTEWSEVEEADFDLNNNVIAAEVTNYSKAKVCMTIASENSGYGTWTYGDYEVVVAAGSISIDKACGGEFEMTWDATTGKVNAIGATSDAYLNEVKAAFNLTNCVIGTCVNDENIQANFGWDDEQTDCFAWSAEGATTVNPECAVSVEIPKTGDVSVVAYAVMAIVAAAGMLKK